MEALFGSSVFMSHLSLAGETVDLGEIVVLAYEKSGMTPREWNGLPERTREHLLVDTYYDMKENTRRE